MTRTDKVYACALGGSEGSADINVMESGVFSSSHATKTPPEVRALQTEVSVKPIYDDMHTFHESYQELTSRGFDITGLFLVTCDDHMRVIEFVCVMINNRLIDGKAGDSRRLRV